VRDIGVTNAKAYAPYGIARDNGKGDTVLGARCGKLIITSNDEGMFFMYLRPNTPHRLHPSALGY